MTIEFHVQEIRQKRGLSIRQLALMSGISKSQISGIENGKTMPTIQTICLLAAALKVQPEQLYSYEK